MHHFGSFNAITYDQLFYFSLLILTRMNQPIFEGALAQCPMSNVTAHWLKRLAESDKPV